MSSLTRQVCATGTDTSCPSLRCASVAAMSIALTRSLFLPLLLLVSSVVWTMAADPVISPRQIQVGNLVYAGTKTSKCFSDCR